MIAAGLAGATPHMISATVTAISRLVFEFKGIVIIKLHWQVPYFVIDAIPANMLNEVVSTLVVFLSSANREIVKSTLGFIKLAVHVLPEHLMRPQLHHLVPALLGWAHDHKNHFKTKVRHIFERMIRRFGFQEVYSCANGEEAAKVLVNIKKRKDRAKRKKAHAGDASDEVSAVIPHITTDTYFVIGSAEEADYRRCVRGRIVR
jgi:ribosomal RNA-processing protein 12